MSAPLAAAEYNELVDMVTELADMFGKQAKLLANVAAKLEGDRPARPALSVIAGGKTTSAAVRATRHLHSIEAYEGRHA